jgi:hypothetical protein
MLRDHCPRVKLNKKRKIWQNVPRNKGQVKRPHKAAKILNRMQSSRTRAVGKNGRGHGVRMAKRAGTGDETDDLKEREYRDEKNEIHNHTHLFGTARR